MPRPYNEAVDNLSTPCTICGSSRRFLRDRGPHIGSFCSEGHRDGDWLGNEHFREGGSHYGLLPPEDFDTRRHRRSKKFQIVEHLQVEVRQADRCFLCNTVKFEGVRNAVTVKQWLQTERPALWNRVVDQLMQPGLAYYIVPRHWPTEIRPERHNELSQELDKSQIECDHLIPVKLLELLETTISRALFTFGARRLAVPLCKKCNRGRTLATFESSARLLARWISYYFDGNETAARADPRFANVEKLISAAHEVVSDLRRLQRARA